MIARKRFLLFTSIKIELIDAQFVLWKMDHSQRSAVEISKDENGVTQVLLQSPRGASVRVRSSSYNI